MRKDGTADTWTVIDNYETDKAGTVTKLSDNVGNKVTATNNAFNVPVLGVYTIPGANKIKAVVEAEQVTARLFGGEIADSGITAHYDTENKKWVTDTGDKDTTVTLRIPVNASKDSDVKVVTAKYTRTYNPENILVNTVVEKKDHDTAANNWITVTRSADGTWKSSDGTEVKASSSVDPDKIETNTNGKWTVSGDFKFATTVDSVQNENVALANITNDAPSITTKGGKVLVNSKVDLLGSKYVTQITDKEDDRDKTDNKETKVTSITLTNPAGEKITLTPEQAKEYTITSTGTYTVSVTVTDSDGLTAESEYKLVAATEIPAKVTVKFQDENGQKIGDDEVQDTKVGENYTTVPGSFADYELTAIPNNASGKVDDENVEVIYVYKKLANGEEASKGAISVKYVTTDGKVLDPGSVTMYDKGQAYSTEAKEFPGYKLVETPSNATGVVKEDVDTVTYTYKEIKKLTVFFRDKNDNQVKAPVEITYLDGEDPVLPGTGVDGYTYIEKKTLDNGDIVYVYEQKAKVTTKYVDKDGRDIAIEETALYDKGSAYTTKAKDIEGYKLVKTPSNADGTATEDNTTVTYEYRAIKKIKVFFEDTKQNSLKNPVELEYLDGENPVLPERGIDGYTYLRTVELENGDLVYVFDKQGDVNKVEIEKPNTGDNNNVKAFSGILVIAGIVASVVAFIRRKITK